MKRGRHGNRKVISGTPREGGRLLDPPSACSHQRRKTKREPETGPGVRSTARADHLGDLPASSLAGVYKSGYGGPEGVTDASPAESSKAVSAACYSFQRPVKFTE